ncbi:ABC transporter substrate-binding protein [Halobaculum gomorrense]|uniref:Peptide/nickel transport system substrate-binding protein n=1 Tax=Halobaculum gomorrense TaxID=43928 RepID=A0A1M5RJH4_9EURY|nr:ABC transporter substrate-binding protein [Halobaculum gomorrense]SHH26286.1 peptide/nickel transport system substrate-binding protein [Halobaculum gomorrense]
MSEDTTRRRFLTATGSGVAAALAGCSSNTPGQQTTESADATATEGSATGSSNTESGIGQPDKAGGPSGTLRLAATGPIQTLDPVNAKGSGAGYNQYQESLMYFPEGALPPVGELASDYTVSDDGKTYTFTLKEGVTHHDGQELTASDFVYSWRRLAGSAKSRNADDIIGGTFTIQHEGATSENLNNYEIGSLAVRAPDKNTFEFDMAAPFHAIPSQIAGGAFGVIPEGAVQYPRPSQMDGSKQPTYDGNSPLYEGEYKYQEYFSTAGDGPYFASTGPFKVDSWSKGDQIRLTAFSDYHGEGPKIQTITYTVIGSSNTRYQRFVNGNLDMVNGIPNSKYDPDDLVIDEENGAVKVGRYRLNEGTVVNYGQVTSLETDYILFNCDNVKRPARRAFAYMINQHDIAETIYKGIGSPAYTITPKPAFPRLGGKDQVAAYKAFVKNGEGSNDVPGNVGENGYPYGFDEARLDEAASVMEAAGHSADNPYKVTFTIFKGSDVWDQLAKRIQAKAQAAHIDVTIEKASFGTIIGKAIDGTMDMFSLGDGMEWPESDNFLRFLHAGNPGTAFTRWGSTDKSKWNDFMKTADSAWQNKYKPNRGPGDQNQKMRNEAYITVEQMNWASVQELPTVFGVFERFWYDDVNEEMVSTMEDQKFNHLQLDRP